MIDDSKPTANMDDESWMDDMGWGDEADEQPGASAGTTPAAEVAPSTDDVTASAPSPLGEPGGAMPIPHPADQSVAARATMGVAAGAAATAVMPPAVAAPEASAAAFAPFDLNGQAGDTSGIDLLLDVNLQVSVELGRARMKIGEILALRNGSVIELDRLAGEPADILVNGTLIARGEVVVVDEKFGVRIIEVVSRAKRIASLG